MHLNNMDFDNTDEDWMSEAPTLAALAIKNPFSVPEGYFEELKVSTCFRISMLADQSEVFKVPGNYFDQLPAEIETGISLEKIRSVVIEDGFALPSEYFENLSKRIITKANEQNVAPKSIRRLAFAWKYYAVAASITLFISIATLLNLKSNSFDSKLSKIPDQEIINYLALNTDVSDMDIILQNLDEINNSSEVDVDISTEELKEYIDSSL